MRTLRWNLNNDYPDIKKGSHIDSTAVLIGKVMIGKCVFVAPGAVIRSDEPETSIMINDYCNVQDRVIIHALGGTSVRVGKRTSLSHGCIVHGPCVIGQGCFVGFNSVVFKARLADRVYISHLAVVEGVDIPEGRFIPGGAVINSKKKAAELKTISKEQEEFMRNVIKANKYLMNRMCQP